jgi:O-antigen/teichoic acid export membrane protein
MAHLRFRFTLIGDCIGYAGLAAAVVMLAGNGRLTLPAVFQAMALTMGVATLVLGWRVGLHQVSASQIIPFLRQSWELGRWILAGNVLNVFGGTLFNWNLAWWCGKQQLGVYAAVTNVLRLANPLSFVVSTLIMPNAARTLRQQGMRRAKRVMHRFGLLGTLLLAPYLGLLLIAPQTGLAIFYGWDSTYVQHGQYAQVLRIAALVMGLSFAITATGALLNAVERTRATFVSQLLAAGAYVLVAMPLTAAFGLIGAVAGWLVAATVQVAVQAYAVKKLPDEPQAAGMTQQISHPQPQAQRLAAA